VLRDYAGEQERWEVKATLKDRCIEFAAKLMSIKLVVFGVATWLLWEGKIPSWFWLLCAFALMGIRYLEKLLAAGPQGKA
jgi:hypothetical protein